MSRLIVRAVLVTAALVLAGASGACSTDHPEVAATTAEPTVVRVVDGDTLVVRIGRTDERVRLIGVDTPETVHPSKPVECFGKEASRFTASLMPPGTVVRLEHDVEERDRYGRLLAYVWRASDDVFVNLELVAQGYADVLTIPPNVAHTDEFLAAAREARDGGRGLWQACGGVGVPAG